MASIEVRRGDVWFARLREGDRPVVVLTRDPVANRIGSVVVASVTRTVRGLVSEVPLSRSDGAPTDCVVNLDNIYTIPRSDLRRRVVGLPAARRRELCDALAAATGC